MKEYTIERRYQWRSREGIAWTSWFDYQHYESLSEAEDVLKELRKQKEADKRLLGEYRIK